MAGNKNNNSSIKTFNLSISEDVINPGSDQIKQEIVKKSFNNASFLKLREAGKFTVARNTILEDFSLFNSSSYSRLLSKELGENSTSFLKQASGYKTLANGLSPAMQALDISRDYTKYKSWGKTAIIDVPGVIADFNTRLSQPWVSIPVAVAANKWKTEARAYFDYLGPVPFGKENKNFSKNLTQTMIGSGKLPKISQPKTIKIPPSIKSAAISGGQKLRSWGSSIMGFFKSLKFHSGGTVPGRGDVVSVLKGGETVRTEAQERAIQEQLAKRNNNYQQSDNNEKSNKNTLLPRLSKEDDQYVIGLIADAYRRNRYGFRTLLRS
jgi:hypothetical protein